VGEEGELGPHVPTTLNGFRKCGVLLYREKDQTMKRLDQDHPHPKLVVPGLTCPGRESNPGLHGGRRALKEPFEQLVNSYSEQLHMSARPEGNARDKIMKTIHNLFRKHVYYRYTAKYEKYLKIRRGKWTINTERELAKYGVSNSFWLYN
jgi:hypothetical protein